MEYSVMELAKALNQGEQETIGMLNELGIKVSDVNDHLSSEEIRLCVSKAKEKMKGRRNEKSVYLESLVKENIIFLDTCSIMDTRFKQVAISLSPLLRKYSKKIVIPQKVLEELKKHMSNKADKKVSGLAKEGMEILKKMMIDEVIEIRGEKSDNFADNVFQSVFTKHRVNEKLLLITQDVNLAKDILNLNEIKSVRGKKISVKKLDKERYLVDYQEEKYSNSNSNFNRKVYQNVKNRRVQDSEKFDLKSEIYNFGDEKIKLTIVPEEGDYVISENKTIQLLKCIATGGEGSIYETNTSYICKIYKREKNERAKFEKIKLMISKRINTPGICWPISLVYNKNNEFVGYLMPKANGKELQKCLFIKPLLLKNFPYWKKVNTVELCIAILEKIQFLHDRNVILGDINPMNILVVSSNEVYFVDTDSYQIEGYPCPVGTEVYTAPEIQKRKFDTFLRSFGNEYFAIATLLFMIMLPGKQPYSQQGGESQVENIINMDFSYPLGEKSNKKAPDGPWRYMWSHLSYSIKKDFYTTFRKGEVNSLEKNRITTSEWIEKMEAYLKLLNGPNFLKKDPMSGEIFPDRYKRNENVKYIKCKICKKETSEEFSENEICKSCLNDGEKYRCKKCGAEMRFTNYQKYIRKSKKYETCMDCKNFLRRVYKTERCILCNRNFEITFGEHEYFKEKNLAPPKRCKACRGKDQRNINININKPQATQGPQKQSQNEVKEKRCFITTAVCESFNKPDNCYELTQFRKFRDDYLKYENDGQRLIKRYYTIAPIIVEKINENKNKEIIYKRIWELYLKSCLKNIENKDHNSCKKNYIKMVEDLEKIFLL